MLANLQNNVQINVRDIVSWANGKDFTYRGDEDLVISGFSSLSHYQQGSLTWIKNLKKLKTVENTEILQHNIVANTKTLQKEQNTIITCAVIQEGIDTNLLRSYCSNYFITNNSKEFFFGILSHFFDTGKKIAEKVGSYIGENVSLAEGVIIGCNCTLDGMISIGNNTVIEHNVTILNTVSIGENCIIHSGTVIGKDGFGYAFDENNIPVKVKHFGGVKIGDRVEIGSNCSIDRGTIDSTIIGDDTKIDNLTLIAHNVEIGKAVTIVGCTDIAGSSRIGDKSYIGPQTCVKNQVHVGNNSFVGMGTMVTEDVGDDMFVALEKTPMKNKNYRRFL